MEATHTYIRDSLSRKKKGELVFPTDYRGKGTQAAINKALARLVTEGRLKRLAPGIYYLPKKDPVLGEITPGADEVARMIAQKEKVRIRPTGAYALHRLGLTTQVPTKLVYLTNGTPRQFTIGKMSVRFKPTTPKKLATRGEISGLVIQALEELETAHIDSGIADKIYALLLQESPQNLAHDVSLAPARINDFIVKLLKEKSKDDRLAHTSS
ncbi:hypothetical protein EPD60_07130 [Flaviaesturariibacter flavus]|uniref:Type IV toxin-antitoxin system AbiEi family antitoxin domain-containing protein n=1 Tax=Flaviaesturariibacter flavus TaxID=2502780 RepID=A0A4R1BIP6_9BACT|nr:DUF6088 family protein [Flaviaesturariibacter flavus]TCJ17077.1 hypothetical protein EPD60_07130 [Flaviaesturariibacter flavus]